MDSLQAYNAYITVIYKMYFKKKFKITNQYLTTITNKA